MEGTFVAFEEGARVVQEPGISAADHRTGITASLRNLAALVAGEGAAGGTAAAP
ncbi:hypothetical protein [Microbacterium panaciterrae]|uniref:Uncharacterized protein n=1 Tax=Microbacterium panaciterrae TaxID=985759 RepID=A0ABP8PEP9_9MICO